MTLRNKLKNVKIQNAETIQSYFTRVSQIKEKLEEVYDALTKMFEGKNINRKMTMRNQLKNVKI